MKYSADNIIVNAWAESNQTPDGKWNRIWDIVLKNPITETINIEKISKLLSHEDFYVQIKVIEGKELAVSLTTKYTERYDPVLFDTFRMFEDIKQLLGDIDTIQGQKIEDRFSPYSRSNKTE